jgi:hypothetical protein
MHTNYYSFDDLKLIKAQAPEIYNRLRNLTEKAYNLQTRLSNAIAQQDAAEHIAVVGDLYDFCKEIPAVYVKVQTACKQITRHLFFAHIDNFGTSSTKFQIAIALYNDIKHIM